MQSTLPTGAAIGTRMPMIEGETKVTGNLHYVADIQMADMLHARLVTSQHAHARLINIDNSAATALPGVIAVLTAADLPDILPTTRQRLLLARDRVIFAGQPVALVLAESQAIAEDALEHIIIEYEPLDVALRWSGPMECPVSLKRLLRMVQMWVAKRKARLSVLTLPSAAIFHGATSRLALPRLISLWSENLQPRWSTNRRWKPMAARYGSIPSLVK